MAQISDTSAGPGAPTAVAKPRVRPTFSQCVKAIRRAAGDKRRYTELSLHGEIKFKFSEKRVYDNAYWHLSRIAPINFEQFAYDEMRMEIMLYWRTCAYCGNRRDEHAPAGGQCLFAATKFKERTDG